MAEVDEIKSRLDILDVVSQYAQLQRAGRSYKALCPFHTEKTPSFFVFPERQTWRCFGACASGGDVFSFVMRVENLEFTDALKTLAQRAGVTLQDRRGRKEEDGTLYGMNEAACEFFCGLLAAGRRGSSARAYLSKRGLNEESVEKFKLGLGPGAGESLADHLASKGYNREAMSLAGLVSRSDGGAYRDMFRGRLIFPIWDGDGRLVGFSGRALDDSTPKYLNTPRSPIFDKGSLLYGLHLACEAARTKGVVIVEGYTDAIVAHQHGFDNVVASMGTALTHDQVSLVRRTVRRSSDGKAGEAVLALDPDVAGQEATLRSLESSWNVFQTNPVGQAQGATLYQRAEEPVLKMAALPDGKDPAELIQESPERWAVLVENALPVMDYLFETLPLRYDLISPEGKAQLSKVLFNQIAATSNPFQQDHYFQRLASLLGVSEATLQASLGRPKPRAVGRRQASRRSSAGQTGGGKVGSQEATETLFARLDHDPLEEHCIALLLQDPQVGQGRYLTFESTTGEGTAEEDSGVASHGEVTVNLRLEHFRRVENREVFTNWMKCSTLEILRESLDEELRTHLDYLVGKTLPPADRKTREADLKYCLRRLEERYLRDLNREEETRLAQAEAPEEREEQEKKLLQLGERLKVIFRE